MKSLTAWRFDQMPTKTQQNIDLLIYLLHKQVTGRIEIDVHSGAIAKMEKYNKKVILVPGDYPGHSV